MSKKFIAAASLLLIVMVIAAPAIVNAGNELPKTAIHKILNYKNGLQLTESQIKKLTIINRTIVNKILQARAQAEIRKMEIDEFTSNWCNMHSGAVNQNIKEYYKFLSKIKELELEAIIKAKAVLDNNQLKKYVELASIEALMINMETELTATF